MQEQVSLRMLSPLRWVDSAALNKVSAVWALLPSIGLEE